MKKSQAETAKTRKRILKSASRAFRGQGFDGVSVKELMSEAGLTHGAFYAHFDSKDALMGEACQEAFRETVERLKLMVENAPAGQALQTYLKLYLGDAHLTSPELGCAIPMLGGEVARQSPEVRRGFTAGFEQMLAQVRQEAGGDEARAIATIAQAAGCIVLARAVDDPELSRRIMAACRAALL